jgi:hypothetical protein
MVVITFISHAEKETAAQPYLLRGSADGGLYLHPCGGTASQAPFSQGAVFMIHDASPPRGGREMTGVRIPRLASFFLTIDSHQDTVLQSLPHLTELIQVPLPSRFLSRESVLENMVISPLRKGYGEPGTAGEATCAP